MRDKNQQPELLSYQDILNQNLPHETKFVKNPHNWTWYQPYDYEVMYHPWTVIDSLPHTRIIDDSRGYELSPVNLDSDNVAEPVDTDEEANLFSVFRRECVNGAITSHHLADFNERRHAEIFVDTVFPKVILSHQLPKDYSDAEVKTMRFSDKPLPVCMLPIGWPFKVYGVTGFNVFWVTRHLQVRTLMGHFECKTIECHVNVAGKLPSLVLDGSLLVYPRLAEDAAYQFTLHTDF